MFIIDIYYEIIVIIITTSACRHSETTRTKTATPMSRREKEPVQSGRYMYYNNNTLYVHVCLSGVKGRYALVRGAWDSSSGVERWKWFFKGREGGLSQNAG